MARRKLTLETSGGVTDLEGTVTVTASATPSVDEVDFYVDEVYVETDLEDPFTYEWDTAMLEVGWHQLKAIGTYNDIQQIEVKLDVSVLAPDIPSAREIEPLVQAPPTLMEIEE